MPPELQSLLDGLDPKQQDELRRGILDGMAAELERQRQRAALPPDDRILTAAAEIMLDRHGPERARTLLARWRRWSRPGSPTFVFHDKVLGEVERLTRKEQT